MSTQFHKKRIKEAKKRGGTKKKQNWKSRHFHFVFNEKCQIKVPKTEAANCKALCDSFAPSTTSVLEQVEQQQEPQQQQQERGSEWGAE